MYKGWQAYIKATSSFEKGALRKSFSDHSMFKLAKCDAGAINQLTATVNPLSAGKSGRSSRDAVKALSDMQLTAAYVSLT